MKCVHIIIFFIFFFNHSISISPEPLLRTPITKDASTNLYTIQTYLKTPFQLTKSFLDLGASLSWFTCSNYTSSTFHHYLYNTSLCIDLDTGIYGNCFGIPPSPSCSNDTCEFFPENSVTRKVAIGDILTDTFALFPTTPGQLISGFVFACSDVYYKPNDGNPNLLKGLPKGVTGLAAFGRYKYSLTAQISRTFSSPFVFSICLPSSPSVKGVAFFDSDADLSISLFYTPLVLNAFGGTVITYSDRPSDEYFINVTGINVNGKLLPLNPTLLEINPENGIGGTKITTSTAYTILQTSIFNALTTAFKSETTSLGGYRLTSPVKPFTTCYSGSTTRLGPSFPSIDLVLQSENVVWRIVGANSMVDLKNKGKKVWCLGFLDGGVSPRTSVVIGGHQMADNLLQFDVAGQRLGFSNSLLGHNTTCAKYT